MSCSNPCRSFYMGKKPNGKEWRIFVRSHDVSALSVDLSGHRTYYKSADEVPVTSALVSYEYDEVPCGRCLSCRLQYASEKAAQCLMEMDSNPMAWFLTLTYDNEHIPVTDEGKATLRYEDVQLFLKRLRYYYPDCRYMVAGEYGSQTYRPHYHMILFGCDFPDRYQYGRNKIGNPYYVSKFLDDVWKLGHVVLGVAEKESCGYVARYASKSVGYEKMLTFCECFGLSKPFIRVSKCPPLGRDFVERHAHEWLSNGKVYVSTPKGAVEIPCIRSVRDYLKKAFPDEWEKVSFDKRFALELSKASVIALGLDWYDYLYAQGCDLEARTKSIMKRSF